MSAIKRIVPMMDRILVRRAPATTSTKGGIVLSGGSVKKAPEGTIVAVGPGHRNSQTGKYTPLAFQSGDRVLLPSYGGTKVPIEGGEDTEYLLYRESDIIAKLE